MCSCVRQKTSTMDAPRRAQLSSCVMTCRQGSVTTRRAELQLEYHTLMRPKRRWSSGSSPSPFVSAASGISRKERGHGPRPDSIHEMSSVKRARMDSGISFASSDLQQSRLPAFQLGRVNAALRKATASIAGMGGPLYSTISCWYSA